MGKPHGHCDGFSCDDCNAADDEAMRAEQNQAATFAALVEVARLGPKLQFLIETLYSDLGREAQHDLYFELRDALSRLRAINPKLLEDGR